jgi:hypothetical protein
MMRKTSYEWVIKGFVPAVAGWRLLYHDTEKTGVPIVTPLAGWLVQEQLAYDAVGMRLPEEDDPCRRVCASDVDGAEAVEAGSASNFWRVLAPGEDVPDEATCATACAEYLQKQEAARERGNECKSAAR